MSSDELAGLRYGVGGGLAFVVSGPSGAGKNSVINRVMESLPGLAFSVSYTTRARRAREKEGVDYRYVSRQTFDEYVERGALIEHVTYLGDDYGTSGDQLEAVFERGEDAILNIDVEGARLLQEREIPLPCRFIYVFLTASSPKHLEARLRARGTEDDVEIHCRLAVAHEELQIAPRFDYLVINEVFEEAVDELRSIIVAERLRIRRPSSTNR
jgi:guanylate kinase